MKKTVLSLILASTVSLAISQSEKVPEIQSEVKNVTVYMDAAMITRSAKFEIKQGKSEVKFVNLSPFIDPKTIQVKTDNGIMVEAVNHIQNFLQVQNKSDELANLQKQLKEVEKQITLQNTNLSAINEELQFLKDNRIMSGKNEALSVQSLKDASAFYSTRTKELMLKTIDINDKIEQLQNKQQNIRQQISAISTKRDYPSGEILVNFESQRTVSTEIKLSYLVNNAGWLPMYDIRADALDKPLTLVYKASIKQNTKIDWQYIKLNLSNAEPNTSGVAPVLKTYFLNYNTIPPRYNRKISRITGTVTDSQGEPLPGASVLVDETTIGTTTNVDGKYSINIPPDAKNLNFSFVGFKTQTIPIYTSVINATMEEETLQLQEVVVTALYDEAEAPSRSKKAYAPSRTPKVTSGLVAQEGIVQKQTNVEFNVTKPYSIKSENKPTLVELLTYEIPADYNYYCVPKIDKGAFLMATIPNWEMYNLLDGEANVFFENTYIGSTLLDTRTAEDTLKLSLGIDRSISIKREKLKDYTTKQFIGSNKEETRSWKITVKNNKNQDINLTLLDQIPVSTLEEIEVKIIETTGAKINNDTGEVCWKSTVKAGETKEFTLTYSVKYPKNKHLIIE